MIDNEYIRARLVTESGDMFRSRKINCDITLRKDSIEAIGYTTYIVKNETYYVLRLLSINNNLYCIQEDNKNKKFICNGEKVFQFFHELERFVEQEFNTKIFKED